jgi:hypothetical protein
MMNPSTDEVLSRVDRISKRFGLINSVVTAIADKLAPKMSATACGSAGTTTCYYYCGDPQNCEFSNMGARWRVYTGVSDGCYHPEAQYECLQNCSSSCPF